MASKDPKMSKQVLLARGIMYRDPDALDKQLKEISRGNSL